ncbi:hypothetical protein ACK33X_16280 [Aeromonas veronii]
MIWTPGREVYCWPGETVERLQVIAASMAGAGQLVAGSVDPVYLVALGVVQPPGSAGGHGTRTSRDLDGLVRSCCWLGGTVEPLQVITASMAGAGQLVAGSVDLVHLVALAFNGHGVPVSSRRAPAVPVATVPGQVVIWTPRREGCSCTEFVPWERSSSCR